MFPFNNVWEDTVTSGFGDSKVYVVQTNPKIVERCLLMTTDPGDLVLDPTSGSGTTAYVAEQWGRRWIAIDTSRVAVAIARQRLLTAKFDYYRLRDEGAGVAGGFRYKTVPHVTLKSIAQNTHLDPIFAKHEPILEAKLAACNAALAGVTDDLRRRLELKLLDKQRAEGKRAVTDADRRRWLLPRVSPLPRFGGEGGKGGAVPHTRSGGDGSEWRLAALDRAVRHRPGLAGGAPAGGDGLPGGVAGQDG